jgi:hypothetical protein
MKFEVECPAGVANEIDKAVIAMASDERRDDFRDISEWLIRTGLGEKGAKERLIKEFSERVSITIKEALVQFTIQELEGETEISAEIDRELLEYFPHIDFVLKSGAVELATLSYYFRVASRVKVKDLSVVVKKKEITGIKSGKLQAFVTLDFCGHDPKNPEPFTLLDDRKIGEIDLAEVVKFVSPKAS